MGSELRMHNSWPAPGNSIAAPNITSWTIDDLKEYIANIRYETGAIEFKEVLIPTKGTDDYNKNIRKAASSIGNARGGLLIFGVQDHKANPSVPLEHRILGIPSLG